jgi:hypothetical protein
MNNFGQKKASSLWPLAMAAAVLFAGVGHAYAQTDVRSGVCEDSTCARRAMTVTGPSSSSSSASYVPASSHCRPSTVNNAPVACPTGYAGTRYTTTTTTCPAGVYGPRQVSTGGYNESGCAVVAPAPTPSPPAPAPAPPPPPPAPAPVVQAPPPPTCWADSWKNDFGCPSGQTGENYSITYRECPTGPYGPPTVTQRDYTNTCKAPPPPPTVTCWNDSWKNNFGCPAGQNGENYSITYMECPSGPYGSPTYTQRDYTNTCTAPPPPVYTPPPPPPKPPGCETNAGYVPIGSSSDACNIIGFGPGPFPRGQLYKCTSSGWVQTYAGSGRVKDYCR